ncbi:RING-H2 finger protein ATL57 [Cryptomeria japonica]|uniref:RING-H2 finger protein ATL57 n=1 Tax=Cryptomeria japonica TaxID=3369 RepID=UPI0025AD1C89|nr:RING-H2 finger protein ATL57 [Cryptomeria japonica]
MVVVALVLKIMNAKSDLACSLLVLFVIHSALFIYMRSFRRTILVEFPSLVVAIVVKIVAQLLKIVVKMVRARSPPIYVYRASASPPVEQPPPSSSSYSVDDAMKSNPVEQPLKMGVFSYRHQEEQQQEECVICLGEYQEGEALVALPRCQHNFHVDCIRRWLKCKLRCPICNACPFQELGSHVVLAGNMREGNIGSEDNV